MASLIDVETSDVVTDETVEIPAGTTKEFSIDISSVDTSEAMGITVIRIGSMKPENVKATLIREDGSTDELEVTFEGLTVSTKAGEKPAKEVLIDITAGQDSMLTVDSELAVQPCQKSSITTGAGTTPGAIEEGTTPLVIGTGTTPGGIGEGTTPGVIGTGTTPGGTGTGTTPGAIGEGTTAAIGEECEVCSEGLSRCDDCSNCYSSNQRCDQVLDCNDGSDELNCTCTYDGEDYYNGEFIPYTCPQLVCDHGVETITDTCIWDDEDCVFGVNYDENGCCECAPEPTCNDFLETYDNTCAYEHTCEELIENTSTDNCDEGVAERCICKYPLRRYNNTCVEFKSCPVCRTSVDSTDYILVGQTIETDDTACYDKQCTYNGQHYLLQDIPKVHPKTCGQYQKLVQNPQYRTCQNQYLPGSADIQRSQTCDCACIEGYIWDEYQMRCIEESECCVEAVVDCKQITCVNGTKVTVDICKKCHYEGMEYEVGNVLPKDECTHVECQDIASVAQWVDIPKDCAVEPEECGEDEMMLTVDCCIVCVPQVSSTTPSAETSPYMTTPGVAMETTTSTPTEPPFVPTGQPSPQPTGFECGQQEAMVAYEFIPENPAALPNTYQENEMFTETFEVASGTYMFELFRSNGVPVSANNVQVLLNGIAQDNPKAVVADETSTVTVQYTPSEITDLQRLSVKHCEVYFMEVCEDGTDSNMRLMENVNFLPTSDNFDSLDKIQPVSSQDEDWIGHTIDLTANTGDLISFSGFPTAQFKVNDDPRLYRQYRVKPSDEDEVLRIRFITSSPDVQQRLFHIVRESCEETSGFTSTSAPIELPGPTGAPTPTTPVLQCENDERMLPVNALATSALDLTAYDSVTPFDEWFTLPAGSYEVKVVDANDQAVVVSVDINGIPETTRQKESYIELEEESTARVRVESTTSQELRLSVLHCQKYIKDECETGSGVAIVKYEDVDFVTEGSDNSAGLANIQPMSSPETAWIGQTLVISLKKGDLLSFKGTYNPLFQVEGDTDYYEKYLVTDDANVKVTFYTKNPLRPATIYQLVREHCQETSEVSTTPGEVWELPSTAEPGTTPSEEEVAAACDLPLYHVLDYTDNNKIVDFEQETVVVDTEELFVFEITDSMPSDPAAVTYLDFTLDGEADIFAQVVDVEKGIVLNVTADEQNRLDIPMEDIRDSVINDKFYVYVEVIPRIIDTTVTVEGVDVKMCTSVTPDMCEGVMFENPADNVQFTTSDGRPIDLGSIELSPVGDGLFASEIITANIVNPSEEAIEAEIAFEKSPSLSVFVVTGSDEEPIETLVDGSFPVTLGADGEVKQVQFKFVSSSPLSSVPRALAKICAAEEGTTTQGTETTPAQEELVTPEMCEGVMFENPADNVQFTTSDGRPIELGSIELSPAGDGLFVSEIITANIVNPSEETVEAEIAFEKSPSLSVFVVTGSDEELVETPVDGSFPVTLGADAEIKQVQFKFVSSSPLSSVRRALAKICAAEEGTTTQGTETTPAQEELEWCTGEMVSDVIGRFQFQTASGEQVDFDNFLLSANGEGSFSKTIQGRVNNDDSASTLTAQLAFETSPDVFVLAKVDGSAPFQLRGAYEFTVNPDDPMDLELTFVSYQADATVTKALAAICSPDTSQTCRPVEQTMAEQQQVITRDDGTFCVNTEGFKWSACDGGCAARASMYLDPFNSDNQCACCQPATSEKIDVTFVCDDGMTVTKTVHSAISCSCSVCGQVEEQAMLAPEEQTL